MMRRNMLENQDGATLAYAAIFMAAMLGVVGLSYDLGRHYLVSIELQKAADAAAVAGAYQIDPGANQATVATKIANAVADTAGPLTQNANTFGSDSANVGVVTVTNRNLSGIPPLDSDVIDASYEASSSEDIAYVEVTTALRTNNTVFGRLAGQPATVNIQASAVATRGEAICQITPLFFCNPQEQIDGAGADFDIDDWLGRQVIVREGPGGGGASSGCANNQWFPGNFGFLNVQGFDTGANGLREALASLNGANACFRGTVDTKPGQTNGAREGLNVRFDIYEQPGFGWSNNLTDADKIKYPPAENVRKGYLVSDAAACVQDPAPEPATGDPPLALGFPRDDGFVDATCTDARFGNGVWDCDAYWTANHPLAPATARPPNCTAVTSGATLSRFEVYRHEIEFSDYDLMSDISGDGQNGTGGDGVDNEVGQPVCNGANAVQTSADDLSRDRRLVTLAVVNCVQDGPFSGNVTGLPVKAYANGFMTEPVTADGDFVMEIVGTDNPGDNSIAEVIARQWVEVVR